MAIEDEVKAILDDPMLSETMRRMAESYMRVHADRNSLVTMIEGYQKQYNEMYGLLIGLLRQLEGKVILKRKFLPQLDYGQYKVRWEDAPEEEGVILELQHFSD